MPGATRLSSRHRSPVRGDASRVLHARLSSFARLTRLDAAPSPHAAVSRTGAFRRVLQEAVRPSAEQRAAGATLKDLEPADRCRGSAFAAEPEMDETSEVPSRQRAGGRGRARALGGGTIAPKAQPRLL